MPGVDGGVRGARRGIPGGATVLALLLCLTTSVAHAQTTGDVLRGAVIAAEDSTPLADVEVSARSARTLAVRTTRTDAAGRYVLVFPDTSGEYTLLATRLGRSPARLRVVRDARGALTVPLAVLPVLPQALDPVTVQGRRPPVRGRSTAYPTDGVGASGAPVTQYERQGDRRGDLNILGASVLGATLLTDANGNPTGFSVGGADPSQNSVTINGSTFRGATIPFFAGREAQATSTTYDVSRGGFSGGQVQIGLDERPDGHTQFLRAQVVDPALLSAGSAAARLGREYRDLTLNTSVAGPLPGQTAYEVSTDLSRRTSPLVTLFDASADALQSLGVAADSVGRFRGTLAALGVPIGSAGAPDQRATTSASTIASFTSSGLWRRRTATLRFDGDWRESDALALTPLSVLSAGGRQISRRGGVQLATGGSTAGGVSNATRTYLSVGDVRSAAYLPLPAAQVQVTSALDGRDGAVTNLRFGGNAQYPQSSRTLAWETTHETAWRTFDDRHQFKLFALSTVERFSQEATQNRLGTYRFNSLADLDAGRPASFARALADRPLDAGAWKGALAVGDDEWTIGESLKLTYGGRLEASRFGAIGSYDAGVERAFGRRTDRIPGEIRFTPRAGFSWTPGNEFRRPYGSWLGGIGAFRDDLDPSQLALQAYATAAPTLFCVGAAVPAPRWDQFAGDPGAIPAACLDGSVGTPGTIAGSAPDVTLFDPSYRAATSWKGNLRWTGRLPRWFQLTVEGRYTRGVADPSAVDLNLDVTPRFTLGAEGGRPVFAPGDAFDSGTGAVSPLASRRLAEYGVVTNYLADAGREARELSVSVQPWLVNYGRRVFRLDYTYARTREQARGTTDVTGGDPTVLTWARAGGDRRHRFAGFLYLTAPQIPQLARLSLVLTGRLQSGIPFTPVVAGDINGDGQAYNDAAFIFDPSTTANPALASGLQELLRTAPASTRECLTQQLGRVAGRNSCTGPWSAALDAQLTIPVGRWVESGGSVFTISMSNVLGGLDQLLHGARGVRGWGEVPYADPTLLAVRGFDPATRQFAYDVNPRFGANAASRAAYRTPFRITIAFQLTRQYDYTRELLRGWLDSTRIPPRHRPTVTRTPNNAAGFFYSTGGGWVFRNYFLEQRRDDLLLTDRQVAAIDSLIAAHAAAEAELLREPIARLLAVAPGQDTDALVREVIEPIREEVHHLEGELLLQIRAVLAPDQWRRVRFGWQNEAEQAEWEQKRRRRE